MEYKKNPKKDIHQLRGMLFSISLAATLSLIIFVFEWKSTGDSSTVNLMNYDTVMDELLDIPPTEQIPPPPAKIIVPKIVEVPDEEEISKELDIVIDMEIKETTEVIKVATVEDFAKEETDEIFLIVEEEPEFPGGMSAFQKYIKNNMHYPRHARQMGVEGKVFVEAVVGKDGTLTEIKVLKGVGAGCDEEALRVVQQSPQWKPGRQRGNPVRTRIVIPIVFRMG